MIIAKSPVPTRRCATADRIRGFPDSPGRRAAGDPLLYGPGGWAGRFREYGKGVSGQGMDAKERRFCEEYLADLNAPAAAERAGYSPAKARKAAGWLRPEGASGKPEVIAAIRRMMADRVMEEYARIAFASIGDITDGSRVIEGIGREDVAAVASLKVKGSECDVKMYDKLKALDMLEKRLGLSQEGADAAQMPRITLYNDGSATVCGDE